MAIPKQKRVIDRAVKLSPNGLKAAEFVRPIFIADVELGVTIDDMKKEEYWSHVASKLKPHGLIQAFAKDNEWFAEFAVIATGSAWAKVSLLRFIELDQDPRDVQADEDFGDYTIGWGGNSDKFRVVRNSDKEIVSKGHIHKSKAEEWLKGHIATTSGSSQ